MDAIWWWGIGAVVMVVLMLRANRADHGRVDGDETASGRLDRDGNSRLDRDDLHGRDRGNRDGLHWI